MAKASEARPVRHGMLIGIDPGLDEIGVAVFDLAKWNGSLDLGHLLQTMTSAYTLREPVRPGIEPPQRLARIYETVRGLVTLLGKNPATLVIETPGFAGVHAGRARRQRGRQPINAKAMAGFYSAWGVICAAASSQYPVGPCVRLQPASHIPKPERHRLLGLAADRVGVTLPASKDALDAVWIGAVGVSADWPEGRT